MLENISKLETVINEKTYSLLCKMESPVHECRQALVQFDNFLHQIEENARKATETFEDQSPAQEQVIEDATMVQE